MEIHLAGYLSQPTATSRLINRILLRVAIIA